jgi:hypothetical protein
MRLRTQPWGCGARGGQLPAKPSVRGRLMWDVTEKCGVGVVMSRRPALRCTSPRRVVVGTASPMPPPGAPACRSSTQRRRSSRTHPRAGSARQAQLPGPLDAAGRKLRVRRTAVCRCACEGLGVNLLIGRLLAMDWAAPDGELPNPIIRFIFDGRTLAHPTGHCSPHSRLTDGEPRVPLSTYHPRLTTAVCVSVGSETGRRRAIGPTCVPTRLHVSGVVRAEFFGLVAR